MTNALIKHEQITTTLPKAKELRQAINANELTAFDQAILIRNYVFDYVRSIWGMYLLLWS